MAALNFYLYPPRGRIYGATSDYYAGANLTPPSFDDMATHRCISLFISRLMTFTPNNAAAASTCRTVIRLPVDGEYVDVQALPAFIIDI